MGIAGGLTFGLRAPKLLQDCWPRGLSPAAVLAGAGTRRPDRCGDNRRRTEAPAAISNVKRLGLVPRWICLFMVRARRCTDRLTQSRKASPPLGIKADEAAGGGGARCDLDIAGEWQNCSGPRSWRRTD